MFLEFRKQKMELINNGNFRLFAENGNRERKFVSLGQETINGYQRLLFPQTCRSMYHGWNNQCQPKHRQHLVLEGILEGGLTWYRG
jgi:hypothetical protein